MVTIDLNQPVWWSVIGLAVLLIIVLILVIGLYNKLGKFKKSYLALQTLVSGENLDTLLKENLQRMDRLGSELTDCKKRLDRLEIKSRGVTDQSALIRFNAFENMGSDLSFSLALVNQEGSGFVLSSMNSREESRVYAKPVQQKESSYPLTKEEREAINKALEGSKV